MNWSSRILISLFAVALLGCGGAQVDPNGWDAFKASQDIGASDFSFVNAANRIDTNDHAMHSRLGELIDKLEKTNLAEKKTVADIPVFIRTFLDSLVSGFSIASPGEHWQAGCTGAFEIDSTSYTIQIDKNTGDTTYHYTLKPKDVPRRQMAYFGVADSIALMAYYKGGYGKSEHILIFTFDQNKIIDFWCGNMLTDISSKSKILECLKGISNNMGRYDTSIEGL